MELRVAQPLSDPARPVTVLIAEDEELVRELIARVLWAEGYRTLEARDGAEALHLAHLAGTHLDLVITDVIMPTVDGRELGRRLAGTYPALPVLYISGYYQGDMFHRDGPGTTAPFLRKPFETEALLEKVRALLSPGSRPELR
jgi:CheY-like chemotaxis protein